MSPLDLSIVPSEVVTKVDVDGTVSIESDERTRGIGEDVEGGRGEGEDLSDRDDDLRDESLESGLVRREEVRTR